MKEIIKPGLICPASDMHRDAYDFKNSQLIDSGKEISVVFIGDSITQFCETDIYYSGLGLVVNRGIGCDMLQFLNQRFEADLLQLRPKLGVMLIGVNNTWFVGDEGAMTYEELTVYFEEQYRLLLEKAKEYGQKMILVSLTPIGDNDRNFCQERKQWMVDYNKIIKRLADEYGHIYADCHSVMCKEDGLSVKDGYTFDSLHPGYDGYAAMASVIRPLIEEYLKNNA